ADLHVAVGGRSPRPGERSPVACREARDGGVDRAAELRDPPLGIDAVPRLVVLDARGIRAGLGTGPGPPAVVVVHLRSHGVATRPRTDERGRSRGEWQVDGQRPDGSACVAERNAGARQQLLSYSGNGDLRVDSALGPGIRGSAGARSHAPDTA